MARKKTPFKKEWFVLLKDEEKYKGRRKDGPTSLLLMKLDRIIPKKLSGALNKAFSKAFDLIFEKGTWLIERTYNKKGKEVQFKVSTYENDLANNRKTAKKFRRTAQKDKIINILISLLEGIVMGIFGLAMPDIPIFVGMVLKSVYEVALNYGYDYHDDNEKIFILKIIEVSMMDDLDFEENDKELNSAIDYLAINGDKIESFDITKKGQIEATSHALAKEMLYTKFLQQIMVIGLFGGLFDPAYVNRISTYAELKYRRRFLGKKTNEEK